MASKAAQARWQAKQDAKSALQQHEPPDHEDQQLLGFAAEEKAQNEAEEAAEQARLDAERKEVEKVERARTRIVSALEDAKAAAKAVTATIADGLLADDDTEWQIDCLRRAADLAGKLKEDARAALREPPPATIDRPDGAPEPDGAERSDEEALAT